MKAPSTASPFFAWLTLTRPWNVLAIGAMVMIIQRWMGFPMAEWATPGAAGWIAVPMLVGAAGNLINDYFDVREDRINKPDRALVGRQVKRRVVLVSHWGLSLAAWVWSAWLSVTIGSHWPLTLSTAFTVILYFYSPVLKGRGAWGNLAISLCVGGLVLWGGLASMFTNPVVGPFDWVAFGLVLAGMNFLREWVKDLQDVEGDRNAGHRTLAAILTPKQTQWGLSIGLVIMVIAGGWWACQHVPLGVKWGPWLGAAMGCAAKTYLQNFKSLSAWLKALMGTWFIFLV